MTAAEFSRPLPVAVLLAVSMEGVGCSPSTHQVEADAGERSALAKRLGLLALGSLKAEIRFSPIPDSALIRMEGKLTAQVTQTCVVTLEPVEGSISTVFERFYDPAANDEAFPEKDGDMTAGEGTGDPPDPIPAGILDLGWVVVEQLVLEIDPFPRLPGAVFHHQEGKSDGKSLENSTKGPFEALSRMKGNLPPGG